MKESLSALMVAMVFVGLVIPSGVNAQCRSLQVTIVPTDKYYIVQSYCNHGSIDGVSLYEFDVQQEPMMYGPDCVIKVESYGRDRFQFTSTVRFHQNYCFFKAGKISVTPQDGARPIYTITEGSWSDGRAGTIKITGFDPP